MVQINGFVFEEESQAVKAGREADGIRYIRQKINLDDPEKALQIYNKMVQDKVFETPVGYAFLHELQEELNMMSYIKKNEILPITVLPAFEETEEVRQGKTANKENTNKTVRNTGSGKKAAKKNTEFRARFIASLVINFMLAAAIAAMIVISYMGENVTILNYENKIINRYEQWEHELDEREKAVAEYEKEYGMNREK